VAEKYFCAWLRPHQHGIVFSVHLLQLNKVLNAQQSSYISMPDDRKFLSNWWDHPEVSKLVQAQIERVDGVVFKRLVKDEIKDQCGHEL
jgi:hypothetical protein